MSAIALPSQETASGEAVTGGPFGRKAFGWAMFEFARNPYYNLMVIYVFAPYFAREIAGGGADGQVWAGMNITIAGLVCAVTVPLIGAAGDRGCRLKPVIAFFMGLLGLVAALTWFVQPSWGGWALVLGVVTAVIGYCSYTYGEVLHNAMLARSARRSALPAVSGIGLGFGNLAAAMVFIIMLWAFIIPVEMPGLPGFPDGPLFGLDPDAREHIRIVGPVIAVWLAIFILPFFLMMPDTSPARSSWSQALGAIVFGGPGLGSKWSRFRTQLKRLRGYLEGLSRDCPDAFRFLLARLLFADALAALLTIGGVYASGVLDLTQTELIVLAILSTVGAMAGAFLGGVLDSAFGPRRALIGELMVLFVGLILLISFTRESLLFGLVANNPAVHEGNFFQSTAKIGYTAALFPLSMAVGAVITSARVLMVQLAPPARIGEFFGLFTIAGTITVWMGPALVSILTAVSGSQRIGMIGIGVLLLAGLSLLLTIRSGARARSQMIAP